MIICTAGRFFFRDFLGFFLPSDRLIAETTDSWKRIAALLRKPGDRFCTIRRGTALRHGTRDPPIPQTLVTACGDLTLPRRPTCSLQIPRILGN